VRYVRCDGVKLHGYSDSDWAVSTVERKSTSSGCFILGSIVVSWCSRKQIYVALSSATTEYMAVSLESCEAIWLQ
jgi:hypothetical protein